MKRGLKYLGLVFSAVLILTIAVPSVFSETVFAKSKSKASGETAAEENKDAQKETADEAGAEEKDGTEGENGDNGENESGDGGESSGKTEKKQKKPYTKSELRYLSAIIFCEANDHTMTGMIAVGNVVINRKNNTDENGWGHVNTIKDVIYDRRWGVQFTPAYSSVNSMKSALSIYDNLDSYKGTWRYTSMKAAREAAKAALTGTKVVPDNYYYFNGHVKESKTKCFSRGKEYMIISEHIFY